MAGMNSQYVYFAEACGKIKIGCSRLPHDRIWQVSEWIPFPITLLATFEGGYDVESAFHNMFNDEWSHGEWFNGTPRLLALIDDIACGRAVAIDISAVTSHRRALIAEKKLLSHRLNRLPIGSLSPELHDEWKNPRWKGKPFPKEIGGQLVNLLQQHGLWDAKIIKQKF